MRELQVILEQWTVGTRTSSEYLPRLAQDLIAQKAQLFYISLKNNVCFLNWGVDTFRLEYAFEEVAELMISISSRTIDTLDIVVTYENLVSSYNSVFHLWEIAKEEDIAYLLDKLPYMPYVVLHVDINFCRTKGCLLYTSPSPRD